MKRFLLTVGTTAVVLLGSMVGVEAFAQTPDRAGTAMFNELRVPVTPRTVALGQTLFGGLDDIAGVEAVANNPAALTVGTGSEVMFSRMEYVADIGVSYMGAAHSFGSNSVAITLTAWGYGDIPFTTETNPENSAETWTGGTTVIGGTFSRQFTDRISAGFTLKGISQSLFDASASALAVDGGMTYAIPESGFRFGVAVQNFGTSSKFSGDQLAISFSPEGPTGQSQVGGEVVTAEGELPSSLSVGGAYTRQFEGDVSLTGLLSARSNSYDNPDFGGALEFSYDDLLFLRGGVNLASDSDASAWNFWNVGAGLNIPAGPTNFRIDYAFRPSKYFDGAHIFSLGLGL